MELEISEMRIEDYDEVLALWHSSEGVGLGESDTEEAIGRFLARNPGLSLVARKGRALAGAVLCGHDGRRGYVHHLAVAPPYRREGVGRALVEQCQRRLREAGIPKTHLNVYGANAVGLAFWRRTGWTERTELTWFSRFTAGEE